MKTHFLFICTWLIASMAGAAPRSQEEAENIARNFLASKGHQNVSTRSAGFHLAGTSTDLLPATAKRSAESQPAFYIYNQGQQAFVIVSGDDRMSPVLGYSDDCAFVTENVPDNIKSWLSLYVEAYRTAGENATARVATRSLSQADFAPSVAPLLGDIQYNQDAPYNDQCPLYNGKRCVTGCTATGIAQILRYWKYPAQGTGTHTYTTPSYKLECSFDFENTTFDWDNMLPSYSGNETDEQKTAVSTLMLACGVASDMDYYVDVSGAYPKDLFKGLIEYLCYDPNMLHLQRNYYSTDEWMDLIKTELNEKRPIFYSGYSTLGGHVFVVDGYDKEDKVHVNWGWGGYCNGYFEVITLNSDGAGIGGSSDGSYQFDQIMFVGLQPKSDQTEYVSLFNISTLDASVEQTTKNKSFTIRAYNCYNQANTFNGKLGIIMEKDGTQTELSTYSSQYEHNFGLISRVFTVKIPASLDDGIYDLYLGSQATNETRWNKARGRMTDNTSYKVKIEGDQCTLMPTAFPAEDLSAILTTNHNIYSGYTVGFSLDIKNLSEETDFFGEIGIVIVNAANRITEYLPVKQLSLECGKDTTLQINCTVSTTAGEYTAYTVFTGDKNYYYIDEGLPITINEPVSGNPTLTLSGTKLESTTVKSGDYLTIQANLSLIGSGSVNTTWVCHTYMRQGSQDYTGYVWDLPFAEKGSITPYSYQLRINAEPGTYIYTLYSQNPKTGVQKAVYESTFTVTDATGIQNVTTCDEEPYLCNAPGENELRIYSGKAISRVMIYGLSGQLIRQIIPEAGANNEYLIPASGLQKGGYVMTVLCKDGNLHTIKFIR